jgi:broad specificity phosphatase PhoE
VPIPILLAIHLVQVTDLTFVRHGETLANATGKYNSHTIDTFSAKGQVQVGKLTKALLTERPFDVILVSPSPRALNTIAPYLTVKKRQALVWPLLYECCTEKRPAAAHATTFRYGGKVLVPTIISPHFQVGRNDNRYPAPKGYDEGLAQVEATVAEFRKKYAGKRVLIIGHSGHGGQFIKALTGKSIRLQNAAIVKLKF